MPPKDTPVEKIRRASVITTPPIVCIVGFSDSGKTTLMVKLIAVLNRYGFRVGTIKHDVHGFSIDKPGKDSYRHKLAGAYTSVITSPSQIGLVTDVDRDHSPEELVSMLPRLDIVLAEGFKRSRLPKIEVHRPETGKGAACKDDPYLIAVVSDAELDWEIQQFSTSDTEALAKFILHHCRLSIPDGKPFRVATHSGSP